MLNGLLVVQAKMSPTESNGMLGLSKPSREGSLWQTDARLLQVKWPTAKSSAGASDKDKPHI